MKKEELEEYRLQAILESERRGAFYRSRGFLNWLIDAIAEKRYKFIVESTTKADIDAALKPSIPTYSCGQFYPKSKYHIEEEELIVWSETSLRGVLIPDAYKRYMALFDKYIGKDKISDNN